MSAPKDDALAAAVAEHGPFPMPVGTAPAPMTPDREQEIRTLDLLELMSDRVAPMISGHLAALLAEVNRLRARVAELEARPSPATVLRQVADKWAAHCPEHSDADDVWMDCPEEWVFELRRAADDLAEGGAS